MEMKNYILKSKLDYITLLNELENKKLKLMNLQPDSLSYRKEIHELINLSLLAKAHSFCLDNEKERKKTVSIIMTLLTDVGLISSK